jgi:hypothetical protein
VPRSARLAAPPATACSRVLRPGRRRTQARRRRLRAHAAPPAAGVRKVEARVLGARACDARDVGTNARYAVLAPSKLGEQVLGRGLGPVPRHSLSPFDVVLTAEGFLLKKHEFWNKHFSRPIENNGKSRFAVAASGVWRGRRRRSAAAERGDRARSLVTHTQGRGPRLCSMAWPVS